MVTCDYVRVACGLYLYSGDNTGLLTVLLFELWRGSFELSLLSNLFGKLF